MSVGFRLPRTSRRELVLIIEQDALGRAVEVFELIAPHRPEEGDKAEPAEAERNRDQDRERRHRAARASRSELPTTTSELIDMASAATSGVTNPATASGTATRL